MRAAAVRGRGAGVGGGGCKARRGGGEEERVGRGETGSSWIGGGECIR